MSNLLLAGLKTKMFSNTTFCGRAGTVFVGTALGQGISFVLLPLITGIYGPNALGSAATVLAILGVMSLFTCLQYDNAVIVASDSDVFYLLLLSSIATLGWALLFCCVILLASWIGGGNHLFTPLTIAWTLPPLILTYSHFILLTNYRLRKNQLYEVSLGRIIYYGGTSLLQVAGGLLFNGKGYVFLLAQAIGALASVLYLVPWQSTVRASIKEKLTTKMILREVFRVARAYSNFPKFQMPGSVLNAISLHLPVIFMRVAFSEAWAGWYFVAWRILAAPTVLISQAVGQIFYRDSAERERSGLAQGKALETIVFNLFRISFIPAVALGVTAPFFVHVFLGEEWAPVGTILRILLIGMQVTFFTSPVSMFLNVKGMQAGFMSFCALMLLTRAAGLAAGWWLHSEFASIAAYTMASVAVMLPFLGYVVRSAQGSMWKIIRKSLPLLLDGTIFAVLIYILSSFDILYKFTGISISTTLIGAIVIRELRRNTFPVGADACSNG